MEVCKLLSPEKSDETMNYEEERLQAWDRSGIQLGNQLRSLELQSKQRKAVTTQRL